MNNKRYIYYPLMMLLLALPFVIKGQRKNGFPKAERLALFTDRGLYIAGENVHFTAFVTNHAKGLSRIVYAEILAPDGTRLTGGKFTLADETTHGCLAVPPGSITGNYYLRVYTKYMRNNGPSSFAYVSLKIINPYKKEVLVGNDTLHNSTRQDTGDMYVSILKISTNKKIYLPREKVNVSIKTDGIKNGEIQGLSVSVVPELAAPGKMLQLHANSSEVGIVKFYPENRGLSITGTLKDSITGKGEADVRVNLSIIGRGKTFMATQTDSSGYFFFSLPSFTGNRDLFLGTQNIPRSHPEILVDNDFSVAPIQLPHLAFKLDSAERTLAFQMAQNNRVRQLFRNDSVLCNKVSKPDKAFYGKPSYTLTLDQYVQLPNLEEYFNELPSLVKVRKHHGAKYFKVLGNQPVMSYIEPLVLVDWVAIDNPEKILAASPTTISRIEVVNKPYVIGDMKYGGIISIITKKGDFAGIDLPRSGMFLNYAFLHDNCHCAITVRDSVDKPDTRITLYWNPDLKLNVGNEIHFSFTTADTPGKYIILLQGIGHDGKPFVKHVVIYVRPKP